MDLGSQFWQTIFTVSALISIDISLLTTRCTLPDVSCELLPVLEKHLRVARFWRIGLMLLGDVEGYSELRLARRAGSRFHAASYRGRHLHFDFWGTREQYMFRKTF